MGCRSLCLAFISLWEKLADRISFGVQLTGVGFGVPFFVSGLYTFMRRLADRIFFGVQGPRGVGFGVPFFVSGLYKFLRKLADRIFFGVQGPRGLGLGCRSLCLAFISLWEN